MTDLKNLLENAAGDEPVITEDTLAADLNRGRRSVNRRRTAAAVAGATATAVVAIGAWAVLPDSVPSGNGAGEPAAQETTRPTHRPSAPSKEPSRRGRGGTPSGLILSTAPPMPWASEPVPLVRDDTPQPGAQVHCSLTPQGWRTSGTGSFLMVRDPMSTYPTHAPDPRDHSWGGQGDGNIVTIGPFGDKVGTGWKAQVNAHINGKEAAVFSQPVDGVMRAGGIFVRISSELTVQVGIGPRTGWDVATALRWAGSCDPVR